MLYSQMGILRYWGFNTAPERPTGTGRRLEPFEAILLAANTKKV